MTKQTIAQSECNITMYSLSDYNNAVLIPKTFDLNLIDSKDEWLEALSEWLKELTEEINDGEIREEWIVCDYEGIPAHFVGEWDISDSYWTFKEVAEASCYELEVFEAAADLDIEPEMVEELYSGEWDTDENFAFDMAEQTGYEESNNWPQSCIDWAHAARELMFDYGSSNGHYFRTSY